MSLEGHAGTIPFRDWHLWYGVAQPGPHAAPPVVCVPGGPGIPHDSIENLLLHVPPGRSYVFYDPSGSGRSGRPVGVRWDLALFADELAALREALGLERVHLLAISVGGLVALEYALRQPPGVASLTLVSTHASFPASRAAIRARIETMPPETRDVLLDGAPHTAAYARAYGEYVRRFMCRGPFPPALAAAVRSANAEAMHQLKGPGPIGFAGALAHLDLTPRLGELAAPTLLVVGRHDAMYPEGVEAMRRAAPGLRVAVFDDSSHMPHHEEPARFGRTLADFLAEVDAAAAAR